MSKELSRGSWRRDALRTAGMLPFGDFLAQLRVNHSLDFYRLGYMGVLGALYGFIWHFYWRILDHRFTIERSLKIIMKKLAVDQLLFTPIFNLFNLTLVVLFQFQGNLGNLGNILETYYLSVLLVNWFFWFPANFINLKAVASHHRVRYLNFAFLIWTPVFSLLGHGELWLGWLGEWVYLVYLDPGLVIAIATTALVLLIAVLKHSSDNPCPIQPDVKNGNIPDSLLIKEKESVKGWKEIKKEIMDVHLKAFTNKKLKFPEWILSRLFTNRGSRYFVAQYEKAKIIVGYIVANRLESLDEPLPKLVSLIVGDYRAVVNSIRADANYKKKNTMYISSWAVLPGYQSKKIGTELFNKCIEDAKGKGFDYVTIHTHLEIEKLRKMGLFGLGKKEYVVEQIGERLENFMGSGVIFYYYRISIKGKEQISEAPGTIKVENNNAQPKSVKKNGYGSKDILLGDTSTLAKEPSRNSVKISGSTRTTTSTKKDESLIVANSTKKEPKKPIYLFTIFMVINILIIGYYTWTFLTFISTSKINLILVYLVYFIGIPIGTVVHELIHAVTAILLRCEFLQFLIPRSYGGNILKRLFSKVGLSRFFGISERNYFGVDLVAPNYLYRIIVSLAPYIVLLPTSIYFLEHQNVFLSLLGYPLLYTAILPLPGDLGKYLFRSEFINDLWIDIGKGMPWHKALIKKRIFGAFRDVPKGDTLVPWKEVEKVLTMVQKDRFAPETKRNQELRKLVWRKGKVPLATLYQDNPILSKVNPKEGKIQDYTQRSTLPPPIIVEIKDGKIEIIDGFRRVVAANNRKETAINSFIGVEPESKGSPAECLKILYDNKNFKGNGLTIEQLVALRGYSKATIRTELDSLMFVGLVEVDKSRKPYRYYLSDTLKGVPPEVIEKICDLTELKHYRVHYEQITQVIEHIREILDYSKLEELLGVVMPKRYIPEIIKEIMIELKKEGILLDELISWIKGEKISSGISIDLIVKRNQKLSDAVRVLRKCIEESRSDKFLADGGVSSSIYRIEFNGRKIKVYKYTDDNQKLADIYPVLLGQHSSYKTLLYVKIYQTPQYKEVTEFLRELIKIAKEYQPEISKPLQRTLDEDDLREILDSNIVVINSELIGGLRFAKLDKKDRLQFTPVPLNYEGKMDLERTIELLCLRKFGTETEQDFLENVFNWQEFLNNLKEFSKLEDWGFVKQDDEGYVLLLYKNIWEKFQQRYPELRRDIAIAKLQTGEFTITIQQLIFQNLGTEEKLADWIKGKILSEARLPTGQNILDDFFLMTDGGGLFYKLNLLVDVDSLRLQGLDLDNIIREIKTIFNFSEIVVSQLPFDPSFAYVQNRGQYYAENILAAVNITGCLTRQDKVMVIFDRDIYYQNLNFVFGLAEAGGSSGLISYCRLKPRFYEKELDLNLFQERITKEIIHELGHLFGLGHCQNQPCVMVFSSNIWSVDRKDKEFCLDCKNKLTLNASGGNSNNIADGASPNLEEAQQRLREDFQKIWNQLKLYERIVLIHIALEFAPGYEFRVSELKTHTTHYIIRYLLKEYPKLIGHLSESLDKDRQLLQNTNIILNKYKLNEKFMIFIKEKAKTEHIPEDTSNKEIFLDKLFEITTKLNISSLGALKRSIKDPENDIVDLEIAALINNRYLELKDEGAFKKRSWEDCVSQAKKRARNKKLETNGGVLVNKRYLQDEGGVLGLNLAILPLLPQVVRLKLGLNINSAGSILKGIDEWLEHLMKWFLRRKIKKLWKKIYVIKIRILRKNKKRKGKKYKRRIIPNNPNNDEGKIPEKKPEKKSDGTLAISDAISGMGLDTSSGTQAVGNGILAQGTVSNQI